MDDSPVQLQHSSHQPPVSEMYDINSTLIQLTAWEDFNYFHSSLCKSPTQILDHEIGGGGSRKVERWSYPCNRRWRPIGLWDVEAPTFSRQLAHRWRWGCQPHMPATLYPQEDSWYSFLLEAESTPGPWGGWKNWKIQWTHWESNPWPYAM
jgi:hypothetical protein